MVGTLIGIVVGALLGGVVQAISDSRRAKNERARWIDEHRRQAYLDAIEALRRMDQVISRIILPVADREPDPYSLTEFYADLAPADFYGSKAVTDRLRVLAVVVAEARHKVKQGDSYDDRQGPYRDGISRLHEEMRKELGILTEPFEARLEFGTRRHTLKARLRKRPPIQQD